MRKILTAFVVLFTILSAIWVPQSSLREDGYDASPCDLFEEMIPN